MHEPWPYDQFSFIPSHNVFITSLYFHLFHLETRFSILSLEKKKLFKMVTSQDDRDIMFEEEDIPYEEEILRNPCAVKCWLRYIEHKKNAPMNVVNMVSPGQWSSMFNGGY